MLSDAAVRAGLGTLTRLTLAVFVCLLIVASDAEGQAVVSGTVRDESGGPIPGAEVTVSNDRIERRTIADSAGRYEFRDFPPGLKDGLTVEEFGAALDAYRSRGR